MIAPAAEPHTAGAADRIVLAAEGGSAIGFGHVGRCLALWQELDSTAAFVTDDATAGAWLAARGVAWGGSANLATPAAGVIVLDRVATATLAEVTALRSAGTRVALLDDPGPARAVADLVIDPPTGPDWPPAAGRRLAGFEHALIRREVRAAAADPLPGVGVLLTLGGSDPGADPVLARALREAGIDCTPVLGPGYRGEPLDGALRDPADFARALAGAEIVVTGYGHTLLEAAHLGVPAVALAQRGSDARDAAALCEHGFATWVDCTREDGASAAAPAFPAGAADPAGPAYPLGPAGAAPAAGPAYPLGPAGAAPAAGPGLAPVVAAVKQLHADAARRAALSERGRALVDGHGAERVAAALRALL